MSCFIIQIKIVGKIINPSFLFICQARLGQDIVLSFLWTIQGVRSSFVLYQNDTIVYVNFVRSQKYCSFSKLLFVYKNEINRYVGCVQIFKIQKGIQGVSKSLGFIENKVSQSNILIIKNNKGYLEIFRKYNISQGEPEYLENTI